MTGTGFNEYTENYTYDLNNRLTNVSKVVYNKDEHSDNIFSTRYNYDSNGNLFSENTSAISKSLGNLSITANAFGSRTDTWNSELGVTIYNYNLNNQLASVEKDGKTATYTYNPDGYRRSKTVDGVTTNHIWNGTQIVLETDSTDTPIAEYIYGVKRICNEQNGEKTYYLYDAHGDTKQQKIAERRRTYNFRSFRVAGHSGRISCYIGIYRRQAFVPCFVNLWYKSFAVFCNIYGETLKNAPFCVTNVTQKPCCVTCVLQTVKTY